MLGLGVGEKSGRQPEFVQPVPEYSSMSTAILSIYGKDTESIENSIEKLVDRLRKETQTFIWSEDRKDQFQTEMEYLKQLEVRHNYCSMIHKIKFFFPKNL